MMEQGSCERVLGKEVASLQEDRGDSGVTEMVQKISGRRDLERGQSCVIGMETMTYNMMQNGDYSID